MTTIEYIISFLINSKDLISSLWYGKVDIAPACAKLIIVPSGFFDKNVYGTRDTIPKTPLSMLPETDIPFLFGKPIIEMDTEGRLILYADLIASAYFMLSRYEEIIKPECRDQYGRFLSKDSVIFQQGYGLRPLVDEWGLYLRQLLREAGLRIKDDNKEIQKVYLTHDVDLPFTIYRKDQVVYQWKENLIRRDNQCRRPLYIYNHPEKDPRYTFEKIIEIDNKLKKSLGENNVETIYFLIAAGSKKTKEYCDIQLKKYRKLVETLNNSGAQMGLHVSFEGGSNPEMIKSEMGRLLKKIPGSCTKSRHHYLHWTEPEHIEQMNQGGITEDFTLGYADSVGFRVGTCRPYYFINPLTQQVSAILEHPMTIMECSLDRKEYMGLPFNDALVICRKIIESIRNVNGELVLLFHNPIWSEDNYYGELYESIISYLLTLYTEAQSYVDG